MEWDLLAVAVDRFVQQQSRAIQSSLLSAVRYYRQWISGRGPLAQVQCTYSADESCSAFAERRLQEAPVIGAILCIVRRLGRCRSLALYVLEDGTLGWGESYDAIFTATSSSGAIQNLLDRLEADGEGLAVRNAVGRAAAAVAAMGMGDASGAWELAASSSVPIRDAAAVRTTVTEQIKQTTRMAETSLRTALTTRDPAMAATLILNASIMTTSMLIKWAYLNNLERRGPQIAALKNRARYSNSQMAPEVVQKNASPPANGLRGA